jgi:hypothetical protein
LGPALVVRTYGVPFARSHLESGMIKGIGPQALALETAEGGVLLKPI